MGRMEVRRPRALQFANVSTEIQSERPLTDAPGGVAPPSCPFRPSLLTALLLFTATPLLAQLEPPSTGGRVALEQEQRMLGHNRRVLVIGAHPDDEDTDLLTTLVRGMGAEAAYLSLNRGEGGQNLIGPELGEALGILRTEELLAARRLDGARQYFTRAYDFGYSKTLDDTWTHWPRDSVLKDVVRIVRRFRPQVIVSIFSGGPRDGHGQHQAAGWTAREAFRVAGDSARFPELATEEGLRPWAPAKLYRSTWFDTTATTLTLDAGMLDEAVGRSLHQIAMQGRSLHRSQDMGRLQTIGPSAVRVALLEDRTGGGNELFAGIDTTLAGAERAGETVVAEDQRRHAARVEAIRSGILLDVIAGDDRVIPGQAVEVTALTTRGDVATPRATVTLSVPAGWEQSAPVATNGGAAAPRRGAVDTTKARLMVSPAAQALTTPYYMALPRAGDLYRWPAAARMHWGAPFEPAPVWGALRLGAGPEAVRREASFRVNDQARGEVRRPVTVVPRVDVRLDRDTVLVSTGSAHALQVVVTLTHGARDTTEGRVTLDLPPGWPAVESRPFVLTRQDQRESFEFVVRTPAALAAGRYEMRAVAAERSGVRHDLGVHAVEYPHIRPRHYVRPAAAVLVAAPLALPRLSRVGYVRGAADRVPEALRAAGVPVELLDSTALERGDLSRYDAIVIGPRAYETEPTLAEHNARVLDYARNGGLVVVQYQQYQFVRGRYAPYPITIAEPHDRVIDERAAVKTVRADDPVLAAPNRIAPQDWDGWVQERGLYFARTWDPKYRSVIETHDAGDQARDGGLLIGAVGRGTYVYTGIAFFRQLPAGVPGAFRLFANLLALPRGVTP